jgi:hypothetical protein
MLPQEFRGRGAIGAAASVGAVHRARLLIALMPVRSGCVEMSLASGYRRGGMFFCVPGSDHLSRVSPTVSPEVARTGNSRRDRVGSPHPPFVLENRLISRLTRVI